jgi:hypothetical protein
LPELGWIIEMVAYDVSVNVVFFGGAEFDQTPDAWNHRSDPLRQGEDLGGGAGPEMHKWVEQAGRVPGWK